MQCPNCLNELKPNLKHCTNCGAKIEPLEILSHKNVEKPIKKVNVAQKSKKSKILSTVLGLLILLIGVGGYWAYQNVYLISFSQQTKKLESAIKAEDLDYIMDKVAFSISEDLSQDVFLNRKEASNLVNQLKEEGLKTFIKQLESEKFIKQNKGFLKKEAYFALAPRYITFKSKQLTSPLVIYVDDEEVKTAVLDNKNQDKEFTYTRVGPFLPLKYTLVAENDESNEKRITYPISLSRELQYDSDFKEDKFIWEKNIETNFTPKVNINNSYTFNPVYTGSDFANNNDYNFLTVDWQSDEYILPFSNKHYLTDAEIYQIRAERNPRLIRNCINEIYARHGLTFKKQENIEYFMSKSWYRPNPYYTDGSQINPYLSEIEKSNRDILVQLENELKNY